MMIPEWLPSDPVAALYAAVIALAAIAMAVEAGAGIASRRRLFDARDTAANLALYAGYVIISLAWIPIVFALYTWVAAHAVVHLTAGGWHIGANGLWWEWALLLVLEDFCFYWFHRSSHRLRFFWASHVTHHSSRQFNLSVALRQTWVPMTAVVFWLPLPLVGFDPLMVMSAQFFSLALQLFLHTRLVGTLGPIGWIFNTPGHHAVHHGANDAYVDRNFGGVLILWDRLFGTFARARSDDPIRFGLREPVDSHNPIVLAFHEWAALLSGSPNR